MPACPSSPATRSPRPVLPDSTLRLFTCLASALQPPCSSARASTSSAFLKLETALLTTNARAARLASEMACPSEPVGFRRNGRSVRAACSGGNQVMPWESLRESCRTLALFWLRGR